MFVLGEWFWMILNDFLFLDIAQIQCQNDFSDNWKPNYCKFSQILLRSCIITLQAQIIVNFFHKFLHVIWMEIMHKLPLPQVDLI